MAFQHAQTKNIWYWVNLSFCFAALCFFFLSAQTNLLTSTSNSYLWKRDFNWSWDRFYLMNVKTWLPCLRKWCHGLEDHLELEDFYRKVIPVLKESNPGNHVGTTIKLGQHWRLVGESKLLLFRVRFLGDLFHTCHLHMHSDQSSIPLNQKDPRHPS